MGYTLLFLVVLLVIAFVVIAVYNTMIGKKNAVDQAYGTIDVMLKKRYDLIPNLIAAVDRYMTHERDLLVEVTELRARAISGDIPDERRVELERDLGAALSRLVVSAENYPELRSSQNFLQLQGSLNEVEEQLSAARRAYNAAVTDYNNAVEMVPTNIAANMMGLRQRPLFTVSEAEREYVDVRTMFQDRR